MVSLASVFSPLYRDPPKTADDTHSAENTSNVFAFCNPTQSIFYVIICNEYLSIILTFDMFWQLDPSTGRWTTKKVCRILSFFVQGSSDISVCRPLFTTRCIELCCQKCKDEGKSAECVHMLHLVPSWQSAERHRKLKVFAKVGSLICFLALFNTDKVCCAYSSTVDHDAGSVRRPPPVLH